MVLECLSCRLWGCVGSAPVYGQPGEHNPVSLGPFSVSPMGGGWGPTTHKVKAPPGSLSQDREGPVQPRLCMDQSSCCPGYQRHGGFMRL